MHPSSKETLQGGLVEHVGLGIAVHTGGIITRELREDPEIAVDQSEAARRTGDGREFLVHAEATEDPVDFIVEVHGARARVDVRPAVEHDGRDAVPGEEEGRRHSRRACSHDHHRSSAAVRVLARGAGAHDAVSEVRLSVECTAVRRAYRARISSTPRTSAAPSTVTVSTTEPSSTS